MGLFGKSNKDNKNKISLTAEFNQSAQQLFGLILDVESYPKFIGELERVTKTSTGTNQMRTEFVLSDSAYNQARSKVTEKLKDASIPGVPVSLIEKVVPKSQKFNVTWKEYDEINIENLDKPINGMVSKWHFKSKANGTTEVEFETDYSNTSFVVRKILNLDVVQAVFKERNEQTVNEVKKQADKIFDQLNKGPKTP